MASTEFFFSLFNKIEVVTSCQVCHSTTYHLNWLSTFSIQCIQTMINKNQNEYYGTNAANFRKNEFWHCDFCVTFNFTTIFVCEECLILEHQAFILHMQYLNICILSFNNITYTYCIRIFWITFVSVCLLLR